MISYSRGVVALLFALFAVYGADRRAGAQQVSGSEACASQGGTLYCTRATVSFFPQTGPFEGRLYSNAIDACAAAPGNPYQNSVYRDPRWERDSNRFFNCSYDYYENGITFRGRMSLPNWVGVRQDCPLTVSSASLIFTTPVAATSSDRTI